MKKQLFSFFLAVCVFCGGVVGAYALIQAGASSSPHLVAGDGSDYEKGGGGNGG